MQINKLKTLFLSLLLLTSGSVAYCTNAQVDTQTLKHRKKEKQKKSKQRKKKNTTVGELYRSGRQKLQKYIITPIRNNPKTSALVVVTIILLGTSYYYKESIIKTNDNTLKNWTKTNGTKDPVLVQKVRSDLEKNSDIQQVKELQKKYSTLQIENINLKKVGNQINNSQGYSTLQKS